MSTQDYASKSSAYFANARRDIEPLLPVRCGRVLELGCGSGATLAWLAAAGRASQTTGIEIHPAAAAQAAGQVDMVHCLDFEREDLPESSGPFDLVLCLDVLEHLVDPWRAIDRLVVSRLAPGGTIIVSVPNLRHHRVLAPLVFRGRFDYTDQGPLDRTHLRFFTARSARQLLEHPQLGTAHCLRTGFAAGSRTALANALTLGLLRDFFTVHFLLGATKPPVPGGGSKQPAAPDALR